MPDLSNFVMYSTPSRARLPNSFVRIRLAAQRAQVTEE